MPTMQKVIQDLTQRYIDNDIIALKHAMTQLARISFAEGARAEREAAAIWLAERLKKRHEWMKFQERALPEFPT